MKTYRLQASKEISGVGYESVVIDVHVSDDGKVLQIEEII